MRMVNRILWMLAVMGVVACAEAANTTARLFLSHNMAKPGETIWAGVELRMAPKWHTYWQNAGESGDATKIEWKLPPGMSAGGILWPVPEKISSAGLTTFVYHDTAVLLVPVSIAGDAKPGEIELKAHVAWLECEELCVPGSGDVSAKLMVGAEAKPSKDAAFIEAAQKKLPQPKPAGFAAVSWDGAGTTNTRPFILEWVPGAATKQVDFFPFAGNGFIVRPATETVSLDAMKARVRKEVEKDLAWPREVAGLLIEKDAAGQLLAAWQVKASLAGDAVAAGASAPMAASADASRSLLDWLGLAFLGGLILNLMPCVLPVIALKIFGFVAQSQEAPGRIRKLGVVYALGVVFSFVVMAGIVIALQSAGKAASWGIQFGNPYFVIAMTTLVTLVALNFFGVFEVTLGGGTMGAAAELAGREGASGAFFNGVLATVLATPCTAPFLAPALGFAFAQPPAIIVLMFVAVALGLAAPYVVLSFQPAWLKFLPKPGQWMEKFKTAMGFPMLATAAWLFSIVGRHYGTRGTLWVGLFLVCVAVAAWIWGEFIQRGTKRKALAAGLALLFLFGGYALTLESQLDWRHRSTQASGIEIEGKDGIAWQQWSREAVAKARAEGRPVFVDFTADWCVTCQANKKTSIEIASVRAKLREINALPLLGDYTLVPDDITQELKRHGRAGVPLVLVYPKDATKEPEVLPALLTPSTVLEALDRASR